MSRLRGLGGGLFGDLTRAADATFVVVAGGIFESNSPSNETVSAASDAIGSIGIPVYVIPGNHNHAAPVGQSAALY